MNIREATREDVPQILPVWWELMAFHAERDVYYRTCEGAEKAFANYVHDNIEKDDACVWIAEMDEEIVGYCQCMVAATPPVFELKQYGQIADMAVLEAYRRQGVGERMVERAMGWFHSRGLRRVEVRAAVTNEVSTRFWRKMGFTPFAETMFQTVDLPERT